MWWWCLNPHMTCNTVNIGISWQTLPDSDAAVFAAFDTFWQAGRQASMQDKVNTKSALHCAISRWFCGQESTAPQLIYMLIVCMYIVKKLKQCFSKSTITTTIHQHTPLGALHSASYSIGDSIPIRTVFAHITAPVTSHTTYLSYYQWIRCISLALLQMAQKLQSIYKHYSPLSL